MPRFSFVIKIRTVFGEIVQLLQRFWTFIESSKEYMQNKI